VSPAAARNPPPEEFIMMKAGIDHDAIVAMFTQATAKQGEALRSAVSEATLKALQGRELTLDNIKKVLKAVTTAATTGAARNDASPLDVEAMLTKAFAGMDAALLQAVEANRKALQQFVEQGNSLQEKQLKSALANVEKLEDTFFAAVTKASQGFSGPMQAPWSHVLDAMKARGTDTGAQATQTVEQLMAQAQTALREGRAATAKTAQAMLDGYAALVSGVLIGMSQGLQSGGTETGAAHSSPAAKARKR
jgi:predicted transcriptional regulator